MEEKVDKDLVQRLEKFGFDDGTRYATLWDRFWANFYDRLFISVLFTPFVLYMPSYGVGKLGSAILIAKILFPYAYVIFCHARFGRTIGKKMRGIKVIDKSEVKDIGFNQSLLRESIPLGGVLLVLILMHSGPENAAIAEKYGLKSVIGIVSFLWFVAEVASAAFNEKRRAVHDYVAGTVVVKV